MKVILHIGTEKTGTTSIQRTLAYERDILAAGGILYPKLFGSENHMEIAVAAMSNARADELKMVELSRQDCDHPEYRRRLKDQLHSEIAEGDYHTLIISNEHCHSRLLSDEALIRLVDLLSGAVPVSDIEVVVYLRRQDRLAVSLNSTRIKLGGNGPLFPGGNSERMPDYFCFDRLLDRYARVFGQGKLTTRLFERDRLHDGNVVIDFYQVTGLGCPKFIMEELNTSLSATQGLFLERFNQTFPMVWQDKINPDRGPIHWVIRNACSGPPFRPCRTDAQQFYGRFSGSNAYVRDTYLGHLDRPTLFDEDFGEYPFSGEASELTPDQLFEFVTAIWRHKGHGAQGN